MAEKKTCAQCGSDKVAEIETEQSFMYAADGDAKRAKLTVVVTVSVCGDCSFASTDYRADDIRTEAVKEYLKLKHLKGVVMEYTITPED
jgi:uncharacterized protein YcgI (DUF1989 family)